jgi:hypothetical protein
MPITSVTLLARHDAALTLPLSLLDSIILLPAGLLQFNLLARPVTSVTLLAIYVTALTLLSC